MEEEEDKANIQRHWLIERRIESRCFRRNSGNLEREKRKREREREREMPDIRNPPLLTKKTLFFLGDIYLISPCIWHLYNALFFLSEMYCWEKVRVWNDLARSKNPIFIFEARVWVFSFRNPGRALPFILMKVNAIAAFNVNLLLCTICVSFELD